MSRSAPSASESSSGVTRRDFFKATSAGLPALKTPALFGAQKSSCTDTLYDRAIVIDSLSIEEWDQDGFEAWRKSGSTAIQTSLPNRNFRVASQALESFKPSYNVRWPPWIAELDGTDRFRRVTQGLVRRKYTSTDIEKLLGGNWKRYFGEILERSAVNS